MAFITSIAGAYREFKLHLCIGDFNHPSAHGVVKLNGILLYMFLGGVGHMRGKFVAGTPTSSFSCLF